MLPKSATGTAYPNCLFHEEKSNCMVSLEFSTRKKVMRRKSNQIIDKKITLIKSFLAHTVGPDLREPNFETLTRDPIVKKG